MLRNLKALGLALVAALALSAVGASAASADFITDNPGTTVLTSEALNTQAFENGEGIAVECSAVGVNGTVEGETAESVTVEPIYPNGKCGLFVPEVGTFNARVSTNGCHYLFTTDTEVHISCPEGKQIEVKGEFVPPFFSKCLDIGAQTPTNPEVHYVNGESGGAMDVTVVSGVEGVTYTKTGICGSGTFNDADYDGEVTVTGHDSITGEPVDVTKVE